MDCSLPSSSVHGIFQARVLEWYAIAFSGKSSIESAKTRLGTDCGSDHELFITKFKLKLKVGKTARPFRYDLNQIPYDDTVKVRNRLKGLDLIDRVPDELCMEVHDIVQETGINTKIRLIIFFAAKDGEALYSQQKQDQELTIAQIMNSLLPNSDLN